jgi:predicted regulator of Ras-like GTPase activity (Roadblock/LC7/MglB family)
MVVGESDGLVIDAILQPQLQGDVVAALAASLYRRARLAMQAANLGSSGYMQLDAERGRLSVVGMHDLVIVAVAESHANAGLIRSEMLRGIEAVR